MSAFSAKLRTVADSGEVRGTHYEGLLIQSAEEIERLTSIIEAVDAWQREPYAGNADGGIRWTALRGLLRESESTHTREES
jgi:hypothetical protein